VVEKTIDEVDDAVGEEGRLRLRFYEDRGEVINCYILHSYLTFIVLDWRDSSAHRSLDERLFLKYIYIYLKIDGHYHISLVKYE